METAPAGPAGRIRIAWAKVANWIGRNDLKFALGALIVLFVFVVFWNRIVISVHSGQSGVLWKRFAGTVVDSTFEEGTYLIFPWDKMYIYDVRVQKVDRTVKALSKDGLEVSLDITIRFDPVDKLTSRLHQQVGPDYVETVIVPEVVSAVRAEIGQWKPNELYEQEKEGSRSPTQRVQRRITRDAALRVRRRYVIIDDVLIRTLTLPALVTQAIQRKFEQEQAMEEYVYRIDKEKQEARRKSIEAEGIRDFQAKITDGISDKYLQWRGIEATLELARSSNAKVVVIGGGKNGMPLILNPDGGAIPSPLAR